MTHKFGFEAVRNMINSIKPEMEAARKQSLTNWSLKAERIAVLHMNRQDLPWKPLSPKTIARKVREGHSEKILIMTSTYYSSITSWVQGDSAYVGVKKSVRNKDGEEVADIAKILEFGGGGIPARPLWQPTLKEAIEWHKKNNTPEMIFMRNIKAKYK